LNARNNAVLPGTLATVWSYDTGGPISASPSVVGDTLFVGNNTGRFVALDVRSGRERWHADERSALMSDPLVIGRNVIVGEGDENSMVMNGVVHVGGGANALLSLDRYTGALRWSAPIDGTGMPTPAYVGGRVVAHIGNGDLVSVSPDTGRVAFSRNIGTTPSMVAVLPLGGDTVVSAGQTQTVVVAVHASSGQTIWRTPIPNGSALGDCPLASNGSQIVGDYLYPLPGQPYVKAGTVGEQRAYALDARTGSPVWNVHLETGLSPFRNQAAIPMIDRGRMFVGSSLAPEMHAIDVATGRLVWRKRVDGPVKGGSVARDGIVYFGDFGGRLWALRESDGSVVGTLDVGTPFNVDSPIIVGRTLVVPSLTGRVLALPLAALHGAHDVRAPHKVASSWFAPAVLASFRRRDRNHDGVLERRELAGTTLFDDFARADIDRSGTIGPLEFGMAVTAGWVR
jgi:outer membrane protein assembly factor BamB